MKQSQSVNTIAKSTKVRKVHPSNETPKGDYRRLKKVLEDHHKKTIHEFTQKHGKILDKLKSKGVILAGAAILVSTMIASTPSIVNAINSHSKEERLGLGNLISRIKSILNGKKALDKIQEETIAQTLSNQFNLKLTSSLQGHKLNEIYGYIGAEQHLRRWPGDSLEKHDITRAGMAPLRGAFGDFDNEEQEKYYIAVQLHELPNWNSRWSTLKPWYQFRKMFVYNPDNGRGMVVVLGDSGPALWTGKTFGGSPEVMKYLERVDGSQKGKVIVLFINDPENKIALGPSSEDFGMSIVAKR